MSSSLYRVADRPVFAIIGWTVQGGDTHGRVRVVASRSLSAADLEVRREDYGHMWGTDWRAIMEALYRSWAPHLS